MPRSLPVLSLVAVATLFWVASAHAQTKLSGQFELTLLPDYVHTPLQGIDSIVGRIEKKDGLSVSYEIGGVTPPGAPRFGGSFTNYAAAHPQDKIAWQKTQKVNGRVLHLAYTKDQRLIVSLEFAKEGINLSASAKTPEEITEILLMVATLREPGGK